MTDEFITLTAALNVPLLTSADLATLRELQAQWLHWQHRDREHAQARIVTEQKQAFDAFVNDPTPENERRLLLTADEALTGKRYAVLRRACEALRCRIGAEAAKILRPVVDLVAAALRAEHDRRREIAEPVMSSKDRNPTVAEARKALEFCSRMSNHVLWASGSRGNGRSPLELAGSLVALSEAQHLTQKPRA